MFDDGRWAEAGRGPARFQIALVTFGILALEDLGDEYAPDDRALEAVMIAKRHVVTEAQEVVDLAMQTVGGSAYFKTSPLEQAYRDVRAGLFHPMNPERTLLYAGRLALGVPADTVW